MDTTVQQSNIATKVAALNDAFRHANPLRCIVTSGVSESMDLQAVFDAVRHFDTFTENNDPYGEHDFGKFELAGETLLWKIDYYDQALSGWCDPLDTACNRVLTIMLSEEY